MPQESSDDQSSADSSRDLYNLILRIATLPVLLLLIGLSWVIINRLMSPERRQERRNREIRKAVAARKARIEAAASEKTDSDETE